MENLVSKYIEYLMAQPELINSIILWNISIAMTWGMMFVNRKPMLIGASGANGLFEISEQVTWIMCWMFPPIVYYSAYFKVELSSWIWYFMMGVIAYAIGGRWIFEWLLALRAGKTTVEEPAKEVKTESKTE